MAKACCIKRMLLGCVTWRRMELSEGWKTCIYSHSMYSPALYSLFLSEVLYNITSNTFLLPALTFTTSFFPYMTFCTARWWLNADRQAAGFSQINACSQHLHSKKKENCMKDGTALAWGREKETLAHGEELLLYKQAVTGMPVYGARTGCLCCAWFLAALSLSLISGWACFSPSPPSLLLSFRFSFWCFVKRKKRTLGRLHCWAHGLPLPIVLCDIQTGTVWWAVSFVSTCHLCLGRQACLRY